MKTLLIIVSFLIASATIAQNTISTVTIKVNGNRNREVIVDGRSYTVESATSNTNNPAKKTITITDLQPGRHTLQVMRSNPNSSSNSTLNNTTTFNLRAGYDMQITVIGNGGVQLRETRIKNWRTASNTQNRTPMSDANFNIILRDVSRHFRPSSRMTAANNAFSKTGNYFTTDQAMQLVQLVLGESYRLQLAKASYRTITDPANFTRMYDLLNSQTSRNSLAAYVSSYNASNPGHVNNNQNNNTQNTNQYRTPMSDASFDILYRDIQNQWQSGTKMTKLTNAFSNTNNFFTTSQARQLIQLIDSESNRLQLAKSSYRSITDPNNFTQVYDLLNSQSSRNELAAYVTSYNSNSGVYTNPTQHTNQYRTPMSDASFDILYRDIQNQWQSGAKMTTISNAFSNTNNYFTTSQAKQLIQLIDSESNRLQLAKSSYRSITDPNNFTQLYDLLNSQSSKNELAAYVNDYNANSSGNYGGSNQSRTPMSDANFTALYQNIQNQWFPGAKMDLLTSTFANSTNYFTTYQTRQLIALVSNETNRLQLAKSAYRNITDPANFSQLYDLFIIQANRDELAAYVRDFRY